MSDDLNLAHLRDLSDKATPGPWQPDWVLSLIWPTQIDGWTRPNDRRQAQERIDANAVLIAAMRNALPALLDRVEAQAKQLDAVLAVVAEADTTSEFLAVVSGDTHDAAIGGAVSAVTARIRAAISAHLDTGRPL